ARAPSPAQTAPPSRSRGAGRGPRRAAAPAARRARFWVPLVAAAAVVGLVGGIGVGLWWQGSAGDQAAGRVIARAELDPFPDWPGARGAAVVEQLPDGSREVVVDVDAAAADDAPLREVWLIAADASGLVSIGFMDGTSGRFIIPAGIDLAAYPLVDVSAESDDGDPGHSGDSILRGELRTS
ncbi:anti-sigma factor domain-containing protein, partial [Herbiconiux daphne]